MYEMPCRSRCSTSLSTIASTVPIKKSRRIDYLVRDAAGARGNALGANPAILCHLDGPDQDRQLQLIESIGSGLTQPLDLIGTDASVSSDLSSPVPADRDRGRMPTVSASLAASESRRLPPAPIRIGGCGRCSGFGWLSYSVIA